MLFFKDGGADWLQTVETSSFPAVKNVNSSVRKLKFRPEIFIDFLCRF